MTLKNILGGEIFFLLRQEDDRCTGTRDGLCHDLFIAFGFCLRKIMTLRVSVSTNQTYVKWTHNNRPNPSIQAERLFWVSVSTDQTHLQRSPKFKIFC